MSVGILLITHPGIGIALVDNAKRILGTLPLSTRCFEVPFDAHLDNAANQAFRLVSELDRDAGVLLLVDAYGASPNQVAALMQRFGVTTRRVSGVNLPMLLRIMNYAEQSLGELVVTAASGARSGVVIDNG